MAAKIEHLEGSAFLKSRAYSPAVITEGGRIVWLAGQTAPTDESGKAIPCDIEAQTYTCFALIDKTLKRVGGSLANLVWMTVFISDPRYGDPLVRIRAEKFPDGRFPCCTLITVSTFPQPGVVIEIQGIAVI